MTISDDTRRKKHAKQDEKSEITPGKYDFEKPSEAYKFFFGVCKK